jgi:hypothetical protein
MVDAWDERTGWHVHLSVSAQEGGALLEAAAAIAAEQGASLIASADSELNELMLFSREDDQQRAREAVIDLYQRLRRLAGLDAQPARVVSLERPSRKGRSRHSTGRLDVTLMAEATRVLNSESHFDWAVVLAQTACEVYVRDILERRAAHLGDAAIETVAGLRGTNLANPSVRRTFHEITGYAPPDDAEWWREYQAHAQRRHRIVHAGARITRQDAEDSIESANAMITFLHWPSASIDAERN